MSHLRKSLGQKYHIKFILRVQEKQEPVCLDIDRLSVCHIGEFLQYLPAKDERGCVLMTDEECSKRFDTNLGIPRRQILQNDEIRRIPALFEISSFRLQLNCLEVGSRPLHRSYQQPRPVRLRDQRCSRFFRTCRRRDGSDDGGYHELVLEYCNDCHIHR